MGKKWQLTALRSTPYEKAIPKSKTSQDGQYPTWGSKLDSYGNQITWFNYKLHLAVDADIDLLLALEVTLAHAHDSQIAF